MSMSLSARLAAYHRQGGGVLTSAQRRRAAHKARLTPAEIDVVWAARCAAGIPVAGELARAFAAMLGPAAVSLSRWQRQVLAALAAWDEPRAATLLRGLPRGRAATRVIYDETPVIPRTSPDQAGWVRGEVSAVTLGGRGGVTSVHFDSGAVAAQGGGGGGSGCNVAVAGNGIAVYDDEDTGAYWIGDAGTRPPGDWLPQEGWEFGPDAYRSAG